MSEVRREIVFLTAEWADIDDRIRAGDEPAGVPSVAGIWRAFAEDGYDVHVVVLARLDRGSALTSTWCGITFHWIRLPFPKVRAALQRRHLLGIAKCFSLLWQLQCVYRLVRLRLRPNVVYCMRPTFAAIGLIYARFRRARAVLRIYGTWVHYHWYAHRSLRGMLETLGEWIAMRMPFDIFIVTNDGTRGDEALRRAGQPQKKVCFWLNGVDPVEPTHMRSSRAPAEPAEERAVVLMTVGRLARWKRVDLAIAVVAELRRRGCDCRLDIAGGGGQIHELRQMAARLGVQECVRFLGVTPHSVARQLPIDADIMLFLHDLTNLTSTLLEAMRCGACVVARDTGGTGTVIRHMQNGVLITSDSPPVIADAVLQLAQDPDQRLRLGNEARDWANANLVPWSKRLKQEVELIDGLVAGRCDD